MKRFYRTVTSVPAPGGFAIHLDGKPVKTPAGAALRAPSEIIARAVAGEWAAQQEKIVPDSMPVTQILITAQDRVAHSRAEMEKTVFGYLYTDLLCYRAAQPAAVAEKQEAAWDPWLDWFEKNHGVRLLTTNGLKALAQPAAAHEAVRCAAAAMDDLQFTVFQLAVAASGSLVLGLAFATGAASPQQVFDAMHVEEGHKAGIYNEAFYGAAPHEEKRRAAILRDLEAAVILRRS